MHVSIMYGNKVPRSQDVLMFNFKKMPDNTVIQQNYCTYCAGQQPLDNPSSADEALTLMISMTSATDLWCLSIVWHLFGDRH